MHVLEVALQGGQKRGPGSHRPGVLVDSATYDGLEQFLSLSKPRFAH